MQRVRIYTQATNDANTMDAAMDFLREFTLTYGVGAWHGHKEACMVFEVLHDAGRFDIDIGGFVEWLKKNNGQEAVLTTVEEYISTILR